MTVISRRSFLTQAGILAIGVGGVWWLRDNVIWPEVQPEFAAGGGSSGWIAFSDTRPRIVIIDAVVNGAPVKALLDSGAQSSVIDRGLVAELGLQMSGITPVLAFGVSGGPQIGRSTMIDVSVGDLVLPRLRAAALELAPIAAASQRPFSLILGQDVLRGVIADIDFPRGQIAFHDPSDHALPDGAASTPARMGRRDMLVPIMVEGSELEVILDTGASGALALSPDLAETAGLLDGRPARRARSITFGGVSQDRMVRAESLTFADTDYRNVSVHIFNPARGVRIPPGLLGVEVLERFRVIIDLGGGRLHLVPGPPPQARVRGA